MFWSQILIAYSLRLFLLVLEVQSKCKNYKVYFGRSKYVFERCCMKTRPIGNKENNIQRGQISSPVQQNIYLTKISLQLKLDALLSFIELRHKTHNSLLKPITFCTIFASFSFIWCVQRFS